MSHPVQRPSQGSQAGEEHAALGSPASCWFSWLLLPPSVSMPLPGSPLHSLPPSRPGSAPCLCETRLWETHPEWLLPQTLPGTRELLSWPVGDPGGSW